MTALDCGKQVRAIKLGAIDFIEKPIDLDVLKQLVRAH